MTTRAELPETVRKPLANLWRLATNAGWKVASDAEAELRAAIREALDEAEKRGRGKRELHRCDRVIR